MLLCVCFIESALNERVEIARKELQWISAKKELQLDKLRGQYLDRVVVERIVLRAFEVRFSPIAFCSPSLIVSCLLF